MATTTIGGSSNLSSSGTRVWEKTVTDANDVDEIFSNARDIGYTRLNQYRTTVVGQLSRYDSSDLFKIQVQSNGKFALSLRSVDDDTSTDSLTEGDTSSDSDKLLNMTASGLRVQVYTLKSNGQETLVADSGATEGSKKYETLEDMLTGEYKAKKGDYYIKVSRSDEVSSNKEVPYALQVKQGDAKHDYIVTETASEDTTNHKYTKTPSVSSYSSSLSTVSAASALQILASSNQGAADMLSVGYLNMAEIYAKNSGK
ncbi:MAG: hypothetical protein PHE89_05225 [Alphaproteobacteria bacterium]|nr:hypothetical protein [Alphaproteobacteria bacterium]